MIDHPAKPASLAKLVAAVGLVFVASLIGQMVTAPALVEWYPALNKPGFTPPNIVFPIAWSLLYALMALALWRVLRAEASEARNRAVMLFLGQLVLNVLWSWMFFGQHNPMSGLAVVLMLDIAVALTLAQFWRIDKPAGAMLAPYLAWILFATALNGAIYAMN